MQERERQCQEVASLRSSREAANTRERDIQDKLNTLRINCQQGAKHSNKTIDENIEIVLEAHFLRG